MRTVDLNADVGEGGGRDDALFPLITSANIACGGHAGDEDSMAIAVIGAMQNGLAIGAHPGFEDRRDFGRTERAISTADAVDLIVRQVSALQGVAAARGARITHVKPHGALYNLTGRDPVLADAVAAAVVQLDPSLVLYGLAGGALLTAGLARGLRVASEVFADRRYLATGALVPRSRPDAVIADEAEAVEQTLRMINAGSVQAVTGEIIAVRADTVCLHGDSPHAVEFARRLRSALSHEKNCVVSRL
jgi:UPF0271 protein